ncbi:MAG: 4-alpha-glucanotransferase [Burkholderiaceae bacterium]
MMTEDFVYPSARSPAPVAVASEGAKGPFDRSSGILLHPTSLPGPFGSGDFGDDARQFVDWLVGAGQRLWQVLPMTPPGPGHSPYMSTSIHAGNPLLVSPVELQREGLLDPAALDAAARRVGGASSRIDFDAVDRLRMGLLRQAAQAFFDDGKASADQRRAFAEWCEQHADWVDDYALFMALAESPLGPRWANWPEPLRRRDPQALRDAVRDHAPQMRFWRFVQWCFDRQWQAIKRHANERGVRLIGDVPIFCALDSVDVWVDPDLFLLDENLQPSFVAGVPPDYFSATGQLWGNPLYDWPRHAADGFRWWKARMSTMLRQADIVRIDHFRGLVAYWEIPAGAPTAIDGRWVPGPGAPFFEALRDALGGLPIIAEDLGSITPDVFALRDQMGLPGMCVLQFAFGDDARNLYLPHNLKPDCVVYTGTHDNDTTQGWFASAVDAERRFAQVYLKTDGREIHWDLIHAASQSVARLAITPMQDVLGLGTEARMNVPGQADGNWGWRFGWDQVQGWQAERLRAIGIVHGRAGG